MTQQEVDTIFNITILIHESEWFLNRFGKKGLFSKIPKRRDREQVQEWVAKQLASIEVYTIPCGMSWGVLVTKEEFDKYWTNRIKVCINH